MDRPTKEQIQTLPIYKGIDLNDIHIIEDETTAKYALEILNAETHLGFDTESKPIFRKGKKSPGPTLVQLSTHSTAFLLPVRFEAALSASRSILNNPNIKKYGFGLSGDVKELRNKLDIDIKNTEDLAVTLKKLAGEKNDIGARAAVAMVLNQRLAKGAQKSNWGAYPLKRQQILYAANDAYSAISIAIKLGLTEES